MNIEFAKSKSGHDRNQYYLIIKKEDEFVYLVNGTELIEDGAGAAEAIAAKNGLHITKEQAAEYRKKLSPGIRTVGVFVNEDPKTIKDTMSARINFNDIVIE